MNTQLIEDKEDWKDKIVKDYYTEYYPTTRVEKAIFNYLDQDYYASEDGVFFTIYKKENDWFVNKTDIEDEIKNMFGLTLPDRIKVGQDDYIEPARNPIPKRVIQSWVNSHLELKAHKEAMVHDKKKNSLERRNDRSIEEDLENWGFDGKEIGPLNEQTTNSKLTNKFLIDFWPQYRNQLYKGLYNTYHPSAYSESFNRPSSQFEDALEIVGDAVNEGKKLGLLDSSVDWSDIYHYDEHPPGHEYGDRVKEVKRLIDDDGIPTLNDQLEIIDGTNLDWIHGILLFDVLEDIVEEFKHYCGENGVDESGMGKCMDEFPPSPNHEQINRTGGTLKQDYYTLFNFMRDLERSGIPVSDYMKNPNFPNIIKLVNDGTTDYNEEGGDRNSADWENMRTQTEFEMDAPSLSWKPDRIDEQEEPEFDEFSDEELEKRRTYDDFSDEEKSEIDQEYVDTTPFTKKEVLILKTLHKNLTRQELSDISANTPEAYGGTDKKFWNVMKLFGIEETNTEQNTRESRYAKWAYDNWTEDGDYGKIETPIKVQLKWYGIDREESGSQVEYKIGDAEVLGFDRDDAGERADYDFYAWGGEMETNDYGDYESYDSQIVGNEFIRMDEVGLVREINPVEEQEDTEKTRAEKESEIDRLETEIDVDKQIIKKAEDELNKLSSPEYVGVGGDPDKEKEKKTVIGIGKDDSAFKQGKYITGGNPQNQSDIALSQQGVYEQEDDSKDDTIKIDTSQSKKSIDLEKNIKKDFVDIQKGELEKKEDKLKKLKTDKNKNNSNTGVMGKGDAKDAMNSGKTEKKDGYFDLVDIVEEEENEEQHEGNYYLNPEGENPMLDVPPIKIAQKFSDVNGYGNIKYDMRGGNGIAYFTDKDLVIKLTSDESEYNTANKLVGTDNEFIVKVIESAKIKTSHSNGIIFVVVEESLPMTEEMEEKWGECCCGLDSPIHIDYLTEPTLVLPPVSEQGKCLPIYDNIIEIQKNFAKHGIAWSDIGIDNMGVKDGKLVVIDLGETRTLVGKLDNQTKLTLENVKIRPLTHKQIKKQLNLI